METRKNACSFFGHRNTKATPALIEKLQELIVFLVKKKGVEWFLFGSRSSFDDLCLEAVTRVQKEYPHIKRIDVRTRYPHLHDIYMKLTLQHYDDSVLPSGVENAGRASYVERNQAMIDASNYCIFYYNPEYLPPERRERKRNIRTYQPKSGTRIAYEYAIRKKQNGQLLEVFNLYT